ncbi:MAG: septum formation initiator family protein [Acidobacteriota bacterium]
MDLDPQRPAVRRRDTDRRLRPLVQIAFAVCLLLLASAAVTSSHDLRAAQREADDLRQRIAQAERELAALREQRDRLQHDPVALERLARERLGLVHAGDVVVLLPETSPVADPTP